MLNDFKNTLNGQDMLFIKNLLNDYLSEIKANSLFDVNKHKKVILFLIKKVLIFLEQLLKM